MKEPINSRLLSYLFSISILCLTACSFNKLSSDPFWDDNNQVLLLDFEEVEIIEEINAYNSTVKLTTTQGITNGNQALKLSLKADEISTGFVYKPENLIDASGFTNFCLVFDATNITKDYSVQLMVDVKNDMAIGVVRSAVIPIGETKTYFFQLADKYAFTDVGLRDDPKPWDTESVHMKLRGLKYQVDFSKISSISFFIEHTIDDKIVIIDNIRLVESPPIADDYLVGIIDKYGQNAKIDFEGKITSDKQLKDLAEAELAQLKEEGAMTGRSQYGGWLDGPKLNATGYFRTEKIGDNWSLVDPDGYLFFSHGLANVRMANTTSFTGIDFKEESVRYRDPEDVTPEDSRGIVALSEKVTESAFVAYPDRNKMFTGLPNYDEPLANNYSYRRSMHIGPFKHGETYSFYQANLERRYGEESPDSHREKWVDVTLDRFLNWGFTSFGNWADYKFYHKNQMPYFANGWIIGEYNTVSSGSDYWGPMPDVFDPEFARRVKVTVDVLAEEVRNNPWCVGIFIDNEKSWGRPGTTKRQYGIILDALSQNKSLSPLKEKCVEILKQKYRSIRNLNSSWDTQIENWRELERGINFKERSNYSLNMVQDFSLLLEIYADKYFDVVHNALENVLPNHLYMGCRFASWGMSEEVRRAAVKYVDVFSYNYYHEALSKNYWKFLEEIDRPSIIGEFHIGTMAAGMFHPGLVEASDHVDRAKMYMKYMETVIDNPYFVGAHWFQYIDSPVSGRAHDSENYNVGFVSNTDVPYPTMVKAAKEITGSMYQRRFGK